jgi:hypothetical protein
MNVRGSFMYCEVMAQSFNSMMANATIFALARVQKVLEQASDA